MISSRIWRRSVAATCSSPEQRMDASTSFRRRSGPMAPSLLRRRQACHGRRARRARRGHQFGVCATRLLRPRSRRRERSSQRLSSCRATIRATSRCPRRGDRALRVRRRSVSRRVAGGRQDRLSGTHRSRSTRSTASIVWMHSRLASQRAAILFYRASPPSPTIASASISTSIAGSMRLRTSTMLVTGRMSAKNSPCTRPIASQRLMSVT